MALLRTVKSRAFVFALTIVTGCSLFSHPQQVQVSASRLSDAPLLSPVAGKFYDAGVFNPAAARLPDGRVLLLVRAQNMQHISVIGSAVSDSPAGTHFTMHPDPALTPEGPDETGGGVEDPRIVKIGRTWYLTYTAYNGHDAQLALATSRDLKHWQRRGVILPAYKGAWNEQWTKSGAIVPKKIRGKWWMYYLGTRKLAAGEPDADDRGGRTVDYMGLAESDDLLHWSDATPQPVVPRLTDAFDSRVMEPGPPPVVTQSGILLLYNGADANLVYRTGWALFSLQDPSRLLARSDKPFFQPELAWEKTGQVPNVVFLEGAVQDTHCSRHETCLLGYYGAGDTNIGGVRIRIRVARQKRM